MITPPIVIGRNEEGRRLDIVTRQHARVRRSDDGTNEAQNFGRFGGWVNGSRIAGEQWHPLPDEPVLRLADALEIRFRPQRG
jgi:hypothetical protein